MSYFLFLKIRELRRRHSYISFLIKKNLLMATRKNNSYERKYINQILFVGAEACVPSDICIVWWASSHVIKMSGDIVTVNCFYIVYITFHLPLPDTCWLWLAVCVSKTISRSIQSFIHVRNPSPIIMRCPSALIVLWNQYHLYLMLRWILLHSGEIKFKLLLLIEIYAVRPFFA